MSGGKVRVALVATALALAAAACSADTVAPLPDGPAATAAATGTGPASPAPGAGLPATEVELRVVGTPTAADRAVLDGYRRFWASLATAYTTGDLTALRAATAEPATTRFTKVATELRRQQRTLQGPVSLAPLVVDRGGTVTLGECADLRRFRTYDRTGTAVFPVDKGLTTAEVRLRNVGGSWRVTGFETRPSGCRQQGG